MGHWRHGRYRGYLPWRVFGIAYPVHSWIRRHRPFASAPWSDPTGGRPVPRTPHRRRRPRNSSRPIRLQWKNKQTNTSMCECQNRRSTGVVVFVTDEQTKMRRPKKKNVRFFSNTSIGSSPVELIFFLPGWNGCTLLCIKIVSLWSCPGMSRQDFFGSCGVALPDWSFFCVWDGCCRIDFDTVGFWK